MTPTRDEPDRYTLICIPATNIPTAPSTQRTCCDCHQTIWVSHTMHRAVNNDDVDTICIPCVRARTDDPDYEPELRIHPDQEHVYDQLGILGGLRQTATRITNGKLDFRDFLNRL